MDNFQEYYANNQSNFDSEEEFDFIEDGEGSLLENSEFSNAGEYQPTLYDFTGQFSVVYL